MNTTKSTSGKRGRKTGSKNANPEKIQDTRRKNQIARAIAVHNETMRFYENGNQSKMLRNVWRTQIQKKFFISYWTFSLYIRLAEQNGCKRESRRE